MPLIHIRVVGEKDHRLHKGIEIENKISYVDLKKQIETITKVPTNYQHIQFKGEDLPDALQPLLTAKDFDELIIKHSSLPEWAVFLIASDIPKNAPRDAKKKQVLEASHILTRLYTEGFFSSYAEFAIRRIKFIRAYSEFIDDHGGFIKMAVERYFSTLLEKNPINPTLTFEYSEKPVIGIQAGFICNVICGETVQRYYVKGHSAMSSHQNVDMCEIYMYLLLAHINVGPPVHIIPNTHTSVTGVYIATLEVSNFVPSHKTKLTLRAEMELDLIKRLFNVSDLHGDNFGIDNNGNLSVIDFRATHLTQQTA
ncbi:unnamed protein product [Caenorhabditis angaria]|uniref:Ubiquitin-like domain-containing protein n=1 Tax=Caenorhabditis angaria TaxID=860376 RepID=A0A9P1NB35_9PELO|nr:unnamed protein product [Caenorhabditis angaria]